jgi:hypothetical protein
MPHYPRPRQTLSGAPLPVGFFMSIEVNFSLR